MTLTVGDHLVIKRNGNIVEGEAYHEFEVEAYTYTGGQDGDEKNPVRYDLKVKMIE